MRRSLKIATALVGIAVLLGAMARASGVILLPLAVILVLAFGYVTVNIVTGSPSPYPRIASGVCERTETTIVHLSETGACESCTDQEGMGERQLSYRELVFLGVPLVRLSTRRTVLCDLCADPLSSLERENLDSIDRELERNR